MENIRRILNNGGYVPQVVSGTPAWYGDDGESLMYADGKDIRQYFYSAAATAWNYGIPLSSKYGWDYIIVDNSQPLFAQGLAFGYEFQYPPVVLTSFLGASVGEPASTADFTTGFNKIITNAYGTTTTGCTLAIHSGDGSNFPGDFYMGVGWLAIG